MQGVYAQEFIKNVMRYPHVLELYAWQQKNKKNWVRKCIFGVI
jgi:hypothetical protein